MADQETTKIFSINVLGPGTTLNGLFEIDEKLSSGGMGEVFRGHEIMSGHPIAIKVVLPELAKDQTIVGLFNKEARILRDLNHPAIVRYMAFGTDPAITRPYLVMEFIDGPSLVDVLKRGPLPLDEARFLIARLASGLDAAHQLGVIHRDVSCDNVILADGKVRNAKIIDFGIARSTKGGTLLEGKFAGKYNSVSPEQLGLFNGIISEGTDVYSLGLVMANVLRGVPIDMDGTQFEVIEKRRTVPDLSGIDESVRPILELMLQPDPAARNVTMQDIVDWLTPQSATPRQSKPVPTRKPVVLMPAAPVSLIPESAQMDAPSSPFDSPDIDQKASRKATETGSNTEEDPAIDKNVKKQSAAAEREIPSEQQSDGEAAERRKAVPKHRQQTIFAPQGLPQNDAPALVRSDNGLSEKNADLLPLTPRPPVLADVKVSATTQRTADRSSHNERFPAYLARKAFAALVLVTVAGCGIWYWTSQTGTKEETATLQVPALTPDTAPLTKTVSAPSNGNQSGAGSQIEKPRDSQAGQNGVDVATRSVSGVQDNWVRDFDGGSCFFARPIPSVPGTMAIEGIGADPKLFVRMETEFKSKFGVEPTIEVRPIVENQCGVARFLAGLDGKSSAKMAISLNKDRLKSGDPLIGQISGLSRPNSLVYLIDNDGFVYQIDQYLKRSGDMAGFRIKLVELESRKPLPQMVLALASDTPIKGGAVSESAIANNHMPKLLEAIKRDKVNLEYSFAFFELGG